jgi:hypothetical protein
MSSSDRESGVGVGGLSGGRRCAKALALGDGVSARDELGGDVDRLPLRARFLGGEADEETGRSCFF